MFVNFEKKEIKRRSRAVSSRLKRIRARRLSSVVKDIEFDNSTYNLKILFASGKSYIYGPVTRDFYEKFLNSESKGSFYNKYIRNNETLNCLKVIR